MTPGLGVLRDHHREMMRILSRRVQSLDEGEPDPDALVRFLRKEMVPHARGEEAYLYPVVEPLLGPEGLATATMTIEHEVMQGLVERMALAADALRAAPVDEAQARLAEFRTLAVQLEILLRVHHEKEERVYLPILERHLSRARQEEILEAMHALEKAA